MTKIYLFVHRVVDAATMIKKAKRPCEVHFHKHLDPCVEACYVIDE